MKRFISIITISTLILILCATTGCFPTKPAQTETKAPDWKAPIATSDPGKKDPVAAENTEIVKPTTTEPIAAEPAQAQSTKTKPIDLPTAEKDGVVIKITALSVPMGDKSGISLDDFFEGKDRAGNRITTVIFHSPLNGKLVSYPNGQSRYFPPEYACTESLTVEFVVKSGTNVETVLSIQVFDPNAKTKKSEPVKQTASNDGTTLRIVSPISGSTNSGVICPIRGTSTNLGSGGINIFVRNANGDVYPQPAPDIRNGEFTSIVYLGEANGSGVGETFTIWAETSKKQKSPAVKVTRTN
jgi:hypothetical protein